MANVIPHFEKFVKVVLEFRFCMHGQRLNAFEMNSTYYLTNLSILIAANALNYI